MIHFARAAVLGLILTWIGGCATTTIKAESEQPPTQHYRVIAIDSVGASKFAYNFRLGFDERLKETKVFAELLDPAPEALPESTIVLSGGLVADRGGSGGCLAGSRRPS